MRTPRSILREQAALLGAKTKNLVEASAQTHVADNSPNINHNFLLVVPALDYAYSLFAIWHGPGIYPVGVMGNKYQFGTEQEFIDWLGATLSSPDTKRIVSNLLAQVAA